jgi:hypothetical protein
VNHDFRRIQEICNEVRPALKECVISQKFHLDEVFGYVHVEGDKHMVTVLPLAFREEIIRNFKAACSDQWNGLRDSFVAELQGIDAEPANGRLRTLFETPEGLFLVGVQIHEGALS